MTNKVNVMAQLSDKQKELIRRESISLAFSDLLEENLSRVPPTRKRR